MGRLAYRASCEAASRTAARQHQQAAGAWKLELRRSDHAGDSSGDGSYQHGLYRAAECDLADLAAGPDTTHPNAIGRTPSTGGSVVLDRSGIQFLSCA